MVTQIHSHHFMASHGRDRASSGHSSPGRIRSNSSRASPAEFDPLRPPKRSHTIQNDSKGSTFRELAEKADGPDAFETSEHTDNEDVADAGRGSIDLDELPIELITLTDRYSCSLALGVQK